MKKLLLVLLLLVIATPLFGADPLKHVTEMAIIKNLLVPPAKVVEARDLGNIYELVISIPGREKQISYVTKDGSYLLMGGMLVNKEKTNVTKERYDLINKVELASLPLNEAIVIKRGSGAKKLVMFDDIDCPFCKQAYDWLKTQPDSTLYVFLLPLPMHPASHDKSIRVLCDKERQTALEHAESDQDLTAEKCEAGEKILQVHEALAQKLGVTGTPLFITESGTRITGFDQPAIAGYLQK